ncbi:hypothetical protein HanPSC8_Chr06g0268331 [Helianthus annuus]|nr:hypothetical protein HanPSC8_Chr06g0268331 [Helianthus annuus]
MSRRAKRSPKIVFVTSILTRRAMRRRRSLKPHDHLLHSQQKVEHQGTMEASP